MKATGIIRRIDELGRIVVPKEIRRNLRIKDGENLEIFIEGEDSIVLKKHSAIKNISDFGQNFTDSIYNFLKHNIIICDNNTVLAASGNLKKEIIGKNISEELENKINRREEMLENHKKTIKIIEEKEYEATYAISPIIAHGDVFGTVLIFSLDKEITDNDYKIVQIVSKIFNTHLEQV